MRQIQRYVDMIEDELEGARDYAEMYLSFKSKGNTTWATRFHEMAEDELKHSLFIHEKAIAEINELSSVFTPPTEMQEKWDLAHKKYVEKNAWIRQMLGM